MTGKMTGKIIDFRFIVNLSASEVYSIKARYFYHSLPYHT